MQWPLLPRELAVRSIPFLFFLASGCTFPQYNAEIISGSDNQVAVKSGTSANPGPLASDHCARYGKQAVLVSTRPLSRFPASNYLLYKFKCVFEEGQIQAASPDTQQPEKAASFGSAVIVSRSGFLLTNAHVVKGCSEIRVRLGDEMSTATVVFLDEANDLALLGSSSPAPFVATFRAARGIRPGDSIVAVGFPLKGLLAEGPSVTTGIVSALAGPGNDVRLIQITAPVQPGSSGGPVLDKAGNLVGITVGKLDALKVAAITGDIPQNVNFALNARLALTFLDANDVGYQIAPSTATLETADIAERASKFTVPIECAG